MSQTFEESPISDTKMDISEATTSQESPSNSPDVDQRQPNLSTTNNYQSTTLCNKTKSTTTTATTTSTAKTKNSDHQPMKNDLNLDNRKNCLDENDEQQPQFVTNKSASNSSIRSALTLANSHPLMSPAHFGDSDSDSGQTPQQRTAAFNYPDVVPKSEPLRLGRSSLSPLTIQDDEINTMSCSGGKRITKTASGPVLDVLGYRHRPANRSTHYSSDDYDDDLDDNDSDDLDDNDSEPDISQYQATVTPLFQSVALVSNNKSYETLDQIESSSNQQQPTNHRRHHYRRRKMMRPPTIDILSDDVSSIDTMSNQSFDDNDFDDNNLLVSASISSSVLDDTGFNGGGGGAVGGGSLVVTPTANNLSIDSQIQQYTAIEEARNSRSWQKITLPDGRVRDIDMKVIEPYKRVLSHGGYLNAGGHNAIVLFSACHLPDRSRADYHYVMDNLFLYVVKTLEQLVTEDYVLIYLHGGSTRGNVPPFPWLKKCYQLLDRRLRKSLKNLFMVHPTIWLKSVVWMARPFISTKFWRKLIYVRTLEELYQLVPVEKAAVPDKVKKYNVKYT